jgi:LacI family transcriptional regulator
VPVRRRVALLIEATNAYARGLLHGVARYEHENARWAVYFEPHSADQPAPRWLRNWRGDGILARITGRRMATAVLAQGIPVIDLRRVLMIDGIPSIGPDNEWVTRLAVEHLRERGFRRFGFCGLARGLDPPMDHRAEAFVRQLEAAQLPFHIFPAERATTWEREERRLAHWVRALSKPVGVVACHDTRGLQLLRTCAKVGVSVPDELAVIGIGNDDCLCRLSDPPLSSIDLGPETIGYQAAALLDRMMSGRGSHNRHIHVPPRSIVTRLSTDVLATQDTAAAGALSFIRGHACENLLVRDVLKHVRLSRSALEPRLKQVTGRTIHQEIRRVRIERARQLLSTTDLPIKQIVSQTGFHSVQYLTRAFRSASGMTPAGYRKQARSR